MATHSLKAGLKTLAITVLAGGIATMASGLVYAQPGKSFDPAQLQQRLEKRVDRALKDTDASAEQKKQIATILATSFKDMRPLRDQSQADRKAMQDALKAPTIDTAKVEAIRSDEMKIADQRSKLFTKALTDAGNVLSAEQRQTFFKNWSNRGNMRSKRG